MRPVAFGFFGAATFFHFEGGIFYLIFFNKKKNMQMRDKSLSQHALQEFILIELRHCQIFYNYTDSLFRKSGFFFK